MSPQEKRELDRSARAFIDEIALINKKYGMGEKVPKEVYENAVTESARLAASVKDRKK